MKSSGATIFWIDGEDHIGYSHISQSYLKAGTTYDSEAMWLIPDDAKDHIVILDIWAEEPAQKDALKHFQLKAEQMRNLDAKAS